MVGANFCRGEGYAQVYLDTSTTTTVTPKEVTVSGVVFKRSKNGNLIRTRVAEGGWVLDSRYKDYYPADLSVSRRSEKRKNRLCRKYTSTGTFAPRPAYLTQLQISSVIYGERCK
jgi:hypothetical protein